MSAVAKTYSFAAGSLFGFSATAAAGSITGTVADKFALAALSLTAPHAVVLATTVALATVLACAYYAWKLHGRFDNPLTAGLFAGSLVGGATVVPAVYGSLSL